MSTLLSGIFKNITLKLTDFDYVARSPDVVRTQDTLSLNLNYRSIPSIDVVLPSKPLTNPVGPSNRLTANLDILDIGANLARDNEDILDVLPSSKSLVVNPDKGYNLFVEDVFEKFDLSSITENFSSLTNDYTNTRSATSSNLTFQDVFKDQQSLMFDLFGTDEIEAPTEINTNKNNIISNFTRTEGDDQNNIFRSDPTVEWETYDGHDGIDTFVTDNSDSYYQITADSNAKITLEHILSDNSSIPEEREILINIERIEFGNKKLAYDLDGNAGIVAKVYGAVLGKDSILDPELIGSGLDQVDSGLSFENFATIAIKSAGLESSVDIVTTLWTNVVGSEPTPDQAEPYINKLENGEMTVGELGMFAANTELNEDNIALAGLQNSGIEFI